MNQELFRIYCSEPLHAANIGNEIEAQWQRVNWVDLEVIGRPLAELICSLNAISLDLVTIHPLVGIPNNQESTVCLSFSVVVDEMGVDYIDLVSVDHSISLFMSQVFARGGQNGDLFNDAGADKRTVEMAVNHAQAFLEDRGGKKIHAPIRVEGAGISTIGSGSFAKKPVSKRTDTGKCTHYATLTALSKRKQQCELQYDDKKLIQIDFEQDSFFYDLRKILGDEVFRAFTTHEKPLANGKYVPVLVSIDGAIKSP